MATRWYQVAPRYTSGSPALVDARLARHVAAAERAAHARALTGLYGDAAREEAEHCGLAGIVWSWRQHGRSVRYQDEITGEGGSFRPSSGRIVWPWEVR
jgi:hypothetical protein